jgi:hypothetical protein
VSDAETRALVFQLASGSDETTIASAARELGERDVPEDLRERVFAPLLAGTTGWELQRAGARALIAHPRAFELAEPLLRVDGVASHEARMRADSVLRAIEEQLARASEGTAPIPDSRFRALVAEVGRLDPEDRYYADTIERAYQFFAGDNIEPIWRAIEDIYDETKLPILIAGYRTGTEPELPDCYPPGLVSFDHQYGGLSCNQVTMFGYALVPPMLAELRALSDEMWGGSGEQMGANGVTAWNARLAPLFEGQLTEVNEGLVVASNHPRALHGLGIVRFGTRFAPWRPRIVFDADRDMIVDGVFGDDHARALVDIGQRLGLPPCTAAITETSD